MRGYRALATCCVSHPSSTVAAWDRQTNPELQRSTNRPTVSRLMLPACATRDGAATPSPSLPELGSRRWEGYNLTSQHPVAVDLFSGAGGLAEGLLSGGVHVAAAVELHPQPALTHAFNHLRTDVLVGDIRELAMQQLEAAVHRQTGSGRVDVVVGGPPCQGFSSAGKKSVSDPRNSLFRQYVRAVEHFRPRIFLLENVPGFKTMYGGAIYREAVEAMQSLGYQTADALLHARHAGVPQRRKRFVMIGWLDRALEFDWTTLRSQADTPLPLFESGVIDVTAGEALHDLADLEPGFEATRYRRQAQSEYAQARRSGNQLLFNHLATQHRAKAARIIRRIPTGGSIRDIPVAERGTKKLTMSKLDPAAVSNTIVSMPDDLLHYAQERILTVREMARLQSFDDDYVFFGKRTSGFVERRVDVPQYTQVGNAVPPVLGELLAREIARMLDAPSVDLRDTLSRRSRHELVIGSSGYSGYRLSADAEGELSLRFIDGEGIPLPIAQSGKRVSHQRARFRWQEFDDRPERWAPGVEPKDQPSWASVSPERGVA